MTRQPAPALTIGQTIAVIAIVFAFAIHLVIWLETERILPCQAAAQKLVNDSYANQKEPTSGAAALGQKIGRSMSEGILYKMTLAKIKAEHNTLGCYKIAILGDN